MSFEDINFPVYRKYKNNKSYFKIINPRRFEEIRVIGSKQLVQQVEAKLYPEVVFIADLVVNNLSIAEEITEKEYLDVLRNTL